ncbi:hypothetical protein Ddye_022041 [Dipteronia dyeriana]|uniref:BSD domain-containing protein n=1 Tax=Dipteronia dyeriana TaxID=168575 RepID=A0AAD9U3A2_9ROSI|nr:hypothetical protein Ddye_022037 [Dipteronia dyeriana]KAK2646846.1 hypothetical protein Ddye_022041 [Dipteronia dyeriana]
MDFFKFVFSAELDSEPTSEEDSSRSENPNSNSIWSTGSGIIKTLATKSESVIGNYRKDFEEFRSGLKKETDVIREVASRTVKDLPASFEIGASDTYCTEPENLEEYERWRQGFVLDNDERSREIESLVSENGVIGEIYKEVVCASELDDEETFWSRYFYRAHKLKQAEEARARLVQRAISMEEEEDLSWDFDDDDDDDESGKSLVKENDDEKVVSVEGKVENGESCKDSDVSLVSTPTQPLMPEEEDLGWDEIEDIEISDENKGGDAVGSTTRVDLQKQLSATEEDEDLSWDIEGDDNDDEDYYRVKL